MNQQWAWFGRAATALALVFAASACSTVVNGALGLAGIGMDDSPVPTAKQRPLPIRPANPSVQSGYSVMPGRPSHLPWDPRTSRLALNKGQLLQTQLDTCEPVRQAVDGSVPARRLMLPTRRVATLGPLEIRAAALPMIMGGDGPGQPDRMMGDQIVPLMGTLPCGLPIFNIGLTWFGSNDYIVAY